MEEQDIRSLITNRQRKKVPARNANLTTFKDVEEFSSLQDRTDKISLEPEQTLTVPKMGKRLAITLEEGVRSSLVSICDVAEVTPETFIEAAILKLQDNKDLLNEICQIANQRLSERKKAGVKKRSQTMMQKYG